MKPGLNSDRESLEKFYIGNCNIREMKYFTVARMQL